MQRSITGAILWIALASGAWGQPSEPSGSDPRVPERVELESAPRPLGKLQERRARERGEDPKPTPGDRLQAYLARPEGKGPFPALVVMPGCAGLSAYVKEALPRLLASWGYVALVVDSLTTRKVEPDCVKESASVDRVADAYGGLYYLAGLPFVDRSRVGIFGVSIGGKVALVLANTQTDATVFNPEKLTFKAGVAYYPTCTVSNEMATFPLLIMIGRDDRLVNVRACENLAAQRAGNNIATRLTIYPGAHHGFIERDWSPGRETFGARFEYNGEAAEDSLRQAREFLARNLKG